MPPTPAVISVAPTGARRTRSDHPALPVTPSELAAEAAASAAAGARVLHLHVRDAHEAHTLDAERYRRAIAAVRRAVGDRLIIQVTTEAVGRYAPEAQMAVVRDLRPEAASLAVRELVPDGTRELEAAKFFAWAQGAGIALQFIVYSAGDVMRLVDLAGRGVVPVERPHALFVLGRYVDGQRATPRELLPFLERWPRAWPWTACAFGPDEAACLAAALAIGGHVRVGFENNLLRPDGAPAVSNAAQVAHVRALVADAGRPLASPAEARTIYGLTV